MPKRSLKYHCRWSSRAPKVNRWIIARAPTNRYRMACLVPLWMIVLLFIPQDMYAQVDSEDEDESSPHVPGLIAQVSSAGQTQSYVASDVWLDRSLSAADSTNATESQRSVTWSGSLWARENGTFQLRLFAAGQVNVSLAGKQVLTARSDDPQWLLCNPIELSFGYHPLKIEYMPTSNNARLGLFWQGPSFSLEPIGSQFFFHSSESSPDDRWQVGQLLNRGLRCNACHDRAVQLSALNAQASANASAGNTSPLAAPALTHLRDALRPTWLLQQLTADSPKSSTSWLEQHQPAYQLTQADAEDIVSALWQESLPLPVGESLESQLAKTNGDRPGKMPKQRMTGDVAQGKQAFVSLGCLACHQLGALGEASQLDEQLFGGGDLTDVAGKRTSEFFRQWISDPAAINSEHRMPRFELTALEQLDLTTYLNTLSSRNVTPDADVTVEVVTDLEDTDSPGAKLGSNVGGDVVHGARLIAALRCAGCHKLPPSLASPLRKVSLTVDSDWDSGCLTFARPAEHIPGFGLNDSHRVALRDYWLTGPPWTIADDWNVSGQELPQDSEISESITVQPGEALLREHNCTACHARDDRPGIKRQLPDIVAAVPELAPRLAALAPPSLTAVGDKYTEEALRSAIALRPPPLRPWLDVQMPRFDFSEEQLHTLAQTLISHDRIPPSGVEKVSEQVNDVSSQLAAARLVTAEGFGCQSCHAIGDMEAPQVDLNARGTNLAMLGERVRPEWFQRWVRNPARIVPRMEMPAIQTPVRGLLHDSLDQQLNALWKTLNTPGFTPPRPRPIRVLRTHNSDGSDRTWLLTDVLEANGKAYIRPLVFGLRNRHNFLFDLEAGQLSAWWIGDTAHQHTRGKTWFWEPGARLLNDPQQALERITIVDADDRIWQPTPLGQIAAHFDHSQHRDGSIIWRGRLHMSSIDNRGVEQAAPARWVEIEQTFHAIRVGTEAESACTTRLTGLHAGDRVRCRSSAQATSEVYADAVGNSCLDLRLQETRIQCMTPLLLESMGGGQWELALADTPNSLGDREAEWTTIYRADVPTDQFPRMTPVNATVSKLTLQRQRLDVVPGYSAVQLPLPSDEMPISFAWDDTGDCFVSSLKGRVLKLNDGDGDGLADQYELISDELPTPYGLWAGPDGIDVLAKFGLLRLTPSQVEGEPHDATMIADGWGSSADYHDWAVGLERDTFGNYYIALPCQQDDRSQAAAHLRGTALKLIPLEATEDPRRYRLETLAAGLRFPMGLALSRAGELFASDNQGNYNPFNELNHLQQGKRYGFINKNENRDGFSPPFESPAINLPHPWSRSVNGICFLYTPVTLQLKEPLFGPFEGHLVGCEMNGRFLVRMSLQQVDGDYQGAAYLFSLPPTGAAHESSGAPESGEGYESAEEGPIGFEGPIACEVSPSGDLYIGNLRDSGWGGGQNTGSIVRLSPTKELPLGIAEVQATATGFEIDFTQAVDLEKAADIGNYQIRSYKRVSTPAYGGDDQDERTERILAVRISESVRRVTLHLEELRGGYVYELNLAPLGRDDQPLFPSQAHYSMRRVPH